MTPHPRDTDPLQVDEDALWDPQISAWVPRRSFMAAVVAGALYGLLVGLVLGLGAASCVAPLVNAAPRSGLQSGDSFSAGRSEAPQLVGDGDRSETRGSAPVTAPDLAPASSRSGGGASPAPAAPVVLDDGGGIDSALMAGTASWYDVGPGLYGAVPSYRWGDARYPVRVCRLDNPARCVTVTILDFCGCPGSRVIDLSRQAFARLESPSRGLVAVTVETGGGPLPATSTR